MDHIHDTVMKYLSYIVDRIQLGNQTQLPTPLKSKLETYALKFSFKTYNHP